MVVGETVRVSLGINRNDVVHIFIPAYWEGNRLAGQVDPTGTQADRRGNLIVDHNREVIGAVVLGRVGVTIVDTIDLLKGS